MNPKLKKINTEYDKNADKIRELQARQKELQAQRTELENLDIIGLVRELGISPDELATLIRKSKNNNGPVAVKEETEYVETE